jgi:hypothetical protein
MRGIGTTLAAVCTAVLLTGAGSAGEVGTWTRVTGSTLSNIDGMGLARASDGLHVVWLSKNGTKGDLLHATIRPNGSLGPVSKVVAGWGALTDGSIQATSSELQVFFSGIRSTVTSDPYSSGTVFTATAPRSGAPWTLVAGSATPASSAYASDWIASTLGTDGTPVTGWTGTYGFFIHKGVDPAVPNVKVQAACCAYQASLATDSASGNVFAAWYSNATVGQGIHVRQVLPSLGRDRVLPGSASADRRSSVSTGQPVGIVGRAGAPGVCSAYGVGYPTWLAVNVWCTTRGAPVRVWTGHVTHFTVARALDGRVWALWSTSSTLYAARSNRSVTQFGAAVPVAPPRGTSTIWNVTGDGSASPTAALDLLASVTTHGIAFWHTRVEPGLTVLVHTAPGGRREFSVLDAGDPVHGAHIQLTGPHATTLPAPAGTASATLPAGHYTATATAAGYTAAKTAFIVPQA